MYGVVDIGSNTIRLNIYKVHSDKDFQLILHNKESAGLANYREDGRLTMEGIQKASSVLYDFKRITDELDIKDVLAFATASLRNISNSTEAKIIIEKMAGLNIEIISGEEEGRLGYKGAARDVDLDEGLVIDIGGSSTELVSFKSHQIINSTSLDMGSLSMFLDHVSKIIPRKGEFEDIEKTARKILNKEIKDKPEPGLTMVGVGGTLRAALRINNHISKLPDNNRKISLEQMEEIYQVLKSSFKKSRKTILKVAPDRVHTVTPGICILRTVIKEFDIKEIYVSEFGVREGYLSSTLANN